jgi:hypothetical protein
MVVLGVKHIMGEILEGVGRLESIREPEKFWQVKYRFEITSTYSRKSVGGVGVRVDRKWNEGKLFYGCYGASRCKRRRLQTET